MRKVRLREAQSFGLAVPWSKVWLAGVGAAPKPVCLTPRLPSTTVGLAQVDSAPGPQFRHSDVVWLNGWS